MELRLTVVGGRHAGTAMKIPAPKFLIGRAEDCQMRPKSELVSRHHCVLLVEEKRVAVRDLGSRNGTFVNGDKVEGECELTDGDQLKVGPLQFAVAITASKKRPKVHNVKEAARRQRSDALDEEIDIADMFRDDEPDLDDDLISTTDTRQFRAEDVVHEPNETVDDPTALDETRRAKPQKLPPGKLPPLPHETATSSGEAAAEMLKKYLRR